MQCTEGPLPSRSSEEMKRVLSELNLAELDLDSCEVSAHWKDKLLQIIEKYESVFSRDKMDCGEAKGVVHRINLTDDRPFRFPYRRIPPSQYAKLRTALNEMEEKGIIRKSHSDYASPLVLVWKKNGDLRICTDFRWLNARTVRDAYPLTHQSDVLAALGGNTFFSTMDLTSGYYNVPLEEEYKKYTAFSSPFGLHEYNRLPQGLSNSPATFMRMMMSIFGDENFSSVLCYLDDLMVFAPSESVALQRLEMVLLRLAHHNLKLAPKKCFFLRRSVKFLGHVVCEEGIKTDPGKVEAINNIQASDLMEPDGKTPCQKKIRSFLGMVLYYQHFIEGCSAKAKPLFKLTSGSVKQTPITKGRKPRQKISYLKLSPADWTTDCEEALHTLKLELTRNVTLAHPDFDQHFILAVDASFDGVGAVLSQVLPGEEIARPVAFASRTLSRSQMNYPAHRLEFFALKWAICEKFSHWLRGRHFTVWTDNNPLTYILTKPRLDACEQRWVAKLASYSFDLKYVPGPKNVVADALSREQFVQSCIGHRLITEPYLSLLKDVSGVVDNSVQNAFKCTSNHQVVHKESKSVRRLLKHHDKLVICDGVLYKVKRDPKLNKKLYLFVVPASLKAQVLHGIHDAAGHQGRSRTLSLARQRFFWIEMRKDIDDYLMFGRVPCLPIDVLFQNVLLNEDVVDLKDFVSKLKNDLREAARIAQVHTLKEQERHGRLYNRKVKGCPLAVGDRVMVANRGEKGRRKVADKWESSPYEVMIVYPDINVYRIKSINSDKVRVVHRNLLLPVNFLPIDEPQEQDQRNDDVNDEIAQRDPVDHDDEIVQGDLDHDDRTANWILSNPDGFVEKDGHTYSTDLPDVSDCVSEILDSVSVDAGNLNERGDSKVQRDVDRSDENVTSDVNLPEVNGQDSDSIQGGQFKHGVAKEPVVCTQPRHVDAAVTQTRLGRVIKPPKRLIHEMNNQFIHSSDFTVSSFVYFVQSIFT
ncbi:hypothetical protein PO909_000279 [Leuciscus waleckii]